MKEIDHNLMGIGAEKRRTIFQRYRAKYRDEKWARIFCGIWLLWVFAFVSAGTIITTFWEALGIHSVLYWIYALIAVHVVGIIVISYIAFMKRKKDYAAYLRDKTWADLTKDLGLSDLGIEQGEGGNSE